MVDRPKNRYGNFVLAAAAYVIGVILFSVWSYTAQRNELLSFVDQSLMDAASVTGEIVTSDMIQCLEHGRIHDETALSAIQAKLIRIAHHGKFTSIGAAFIHEGHADLLISKPETESAEMELQHLALQDHLHKELLKLSVTGNCAAAFFTLKSSPHGHMRIAVVYEARNENEGSAFMAVQHSSVIEEELGDQMLRLAAAGIGMVLLAIPLIIQFSRSQKETAVNLSEMNERLQHDMDLQKSREAELKDAISDLERFNSVTAGRESRIIELKAEVNKLLEEMNRTKHYNIDKID